MTANTTTQTFGPVLRRLRDAIPAPAIGWISRLLRLVDPHAQASYSQEGEDRILARIFQNQNQGYYVDVGAHHPYRFSNTCALHQKGWRGINIDADPALMVAFKRHRPGDVNLSTGVSDEAGNLILHVFDEPALNTFDEGVAREKSKDGTYKIVARRTIPVQRLDAILESHLPEGVTIDLLTVDAEGFDVKVLASNNWSRFRPRCVVVEIFSDSLANALLSPVHALLDQHGYELYAKTVNSLIYTDRQVKN